MSNSTCHPSIYRGSGQAHTQYSKSTLRVTMLPVFLLVASPVSVEGLSKDHCLGYDALCTTADYEVRRYKDSVWVGIHGSYTHNLRTDSAPLHLYLAGRNLEEMKIQYTGQELVSLTGRRVLAIYMMLPEELWDNPPTATNTEVFITRFPVMDVFARIIRGFVITDADDFNHTLSEQNTPVNNSNFFVYSCLGKSMESSRLPKMDSKASPHFPQMSSKSVPRFAPMSRNSEASPHFPEM
ncbi:uncharacterized protein [Hemitrygon akajei]|uniref:uncharacterized protein n=1 Tax=Hemitrygon akajei TaxID=2704970 RepID=UPI003BF9C6EF